MAKKLSLSGWLDDVLPKHEALTNAVKALIESLLSTHGVDFLAISGRTKSREQIHEKVDRKRYKDPRKQLTDISGVRIIAFLESDVDRICVILREAFRVNDLCSLDKSALLGTDKLGYRSVHFVCDLGLVRLKLPEYKMYAGLVFEIQVRTVLQHAWAELSHDRGYKFSGTLPANLQRQLHLYAGLLEIADKGFQELANSIDDYSDSVSRDSGQGNLEIEVNTPSLIQYVPARAKQAGIPLDASDLSADLVDVIQELKSFGVKTLKDLDQLFTTEFVQQMCGDAHYETNIMGLLRDLMMFADFPKYFNDAFVGDWQCMSPAEAERFFKKYGQEEVERTLQKNDIEVLELDD